jgi:hypothetical protein
MNPPAHAIVLSLDEKSQIQALDRTQPGLPLKPGKCGAMTHDYKQHGTTTLFAALNVLAVTVIVRCMQRHRREEFIRFLNVVKRAIPAGKMIHAILGNYATHKHPAVLAWLADRPRWASTSRRHPVPGWTPSRTSSLGSASGEASFAPSPTSRPLSPATCRSTTMTRYPSSEPRRPTPSWLRSHAGLPLLSESVH